MILFAVGINHRSAPVELREKVAFSPDRLPAALRELTSLEGVEEAAILSTCNRTELYCHLTETGHDPLVQWLADYHQVSPAALLDHLYAYPTEQAVRHILRVGAGLDSMILGEPQILGQLKQTFQVAKEAGTIGTLLGRLFQHTFAVSKQIRTDTAIGASPVSVAFAAVSLGRKIFGDFGRQTALLIGAGETIELAARYLHDNGIGRMVVANRTVRRAHDLAAQFDGYAIALSEIPAHLAEADIVISSTASPEPIVTRGMVEEAMRRRRHRPIFMVDIAVPRDIEAEVADLEDIYLYTVDDLQDIIQESLKSRQEAASQAEEMIDVQVAHFMEWLRSLDAADTIRTLRQGAEATRDEVLHKAQAMLGKGKPPAEVLQFLANTLTNKLLHAPSSRLRQAAAEGRIHLVESAREIFSLDPPDSQ